MVRRKKAGPPDFAALAAALGDKLRPPLGIVLGSPREAADLAAALAPASGGAEPSPPEADTAGPPGPVVCYQMDLYQAERLRQEIGERGVAAQVVTAPDLWDLPEPLQTLVYPVPQRGERILKLDMLE